MELFEQLESNKREVVEEAKQRILDQFSIVKDPWLMNGFYDYYLSSNSANTIAVLVNVREPHHHYLFERLSDSISKTSKADVKVQALTLLGHIVRSQPTWLYRLPEHHLLKDVMKLLKEETEILPLISALLVLIVLIPMIPYSMAELLYEIFEIFSRLASWNCNPGRQVEEQMIHMQVALYALFLRLYGMFPCNFLSYLRAQYKDKNRPVFIHTIKPMLETVKMNPSLVTTSQDNEKTSERWRNMEVHDVIVECERFSLDSSDTYCAHDSCQLASGFRSRSGTSNSTMDASYFKSLKNLAASMAGNDKTEYFTPSMVFNVTPPITNTSAAVYVPQPEFTHDENIVPQAGSSPPETAEEATPETTPLVQQEDALYTPIRSQSQYMTKALNTLGLSPTQPQSPSKKSPFHFPSVSGVSPKEEVKHAVSPHHHPAGDQTPQKPTPAKALFASPSKIKRQNEINEVEQPTQQQPTLKQSDSVLHESEDSTSENMEEDRSSPCISGGLHMPNSKSMKDFAKRVQRLRHHSQCNAEPESEIPELIGGGSSPEISSNNESSKVRRANSCPEMKKSPASSVKDNVSRTLDETDEERAESVMSNGVGDDDITICAETQTDNFWPMPYEHLFLGIFPTLGTTEPVKASPASSNVSQEKVNHPSIYEVLDRYIETSVRDGGEKDSEKKVKNQLQFLHQQLLFERHRREIHAFKNRRYLADAKSTQALEEHNSALRDQVQLQQKDIDNLNDQVNRLQRERQIEIHRGEDAMACLEHQCKSLELKNKTLEEASVDLRKDVDEYKSKYMSLALEKEKAENTLVNALVEVKISKEQALAGEKGRAELENVNKQLLLIGELQQKYNERLDDLSSLRRSDQELELLKTAYGHEMKGLKDKLSTTVVKLEAANAKIQNLEQIIVQNEETIAKQKRTLNAINEETDEKLKAVEQKYQTQMVICRQMEERILELLHQVETKNKIHRSPDTSSCQEVQVSSDNNKGGAAGVSEKSSPLSCLSSSEGSSALPPLTSEMKGLQAFMDEESPKDPKPPRSPFEPATSPKHD